MAGRLHFCPRSSEPFYKGKSVRIVVGFPLEGLLTLGRLRWLNTPTVTIFSWITEGNRDKSWRNRFLRRCEHGVFSYQSERVGWRN